MSELEKLGELQDLEEVSFVQNNVCGCGKGGGCDYVGGFGYVGGCGVV